MKNIKSSAVKYVVIAVFLALTVVCFLLSSKVKINYNISDYLAKNTETRIALDIIKDEFGMTGNLQVFAQNTDVETAKKIAAELGEIEGVLSVNFDPASERSYKDGNALFVVLIDGDEYSDTAKSVTVEARARMEKYNASLGGSAANMQALQESIMNELVFILIVSLALAVIILLISSGSWLEPFLLLLSCGVAVFINKGTDIIFGEISYITNSVSAILQLALSIDYSIAILHTYRQKCEESVPHPMRAAIFSCLKPVSASALTTVAGMLALLFMSFTIGFDIGIVLMKGIVISVITALTLFPAVILVFDKLLQKTKKRDFVPKGEVFGKIAFRAGKVILPVALVLIVGCGVLQTQNNYSFTNPAPENAELIQTFGLNNPLVAIYPEEKTTNEKELLFREKLNAYRTKEGKPVLSSFTAFSTTVAEAYNAAAISQKFGLPENYAGMLLAMKNLYAAPDALRLTAAQVVNFALSLETDDFAKQFLSSEIKEALLTVKKVGEFSVNENTAEETAAFLKDMGAEIPLSTLTTAYKLYFLANETEDTGRITGEEFVRFAQTVGTLIDKDLVKKTGDVLAVSAFWKDPEAKNYRAFTDAVNALTASLVSVEVPAQDAPVISGVFVCYAEKNGLLQTAVPANELLSFVKEQLQNPLLAPIVSEEMKGQVTEAENLLSSATALLKNGKYQRALFTVDVKTGSRDAVAFAEFVNGLTKEVFGENAHVAGEICTSYDMETTFESDNRMITIFTLISVFLIVAIAFLSLSLPLLLVAIIQGAVWIALATGLITGSPIFFMSYIIANCILMGATIDYGILMSSNYLSLRKTEEKKEALYKAVASTMPTVFSSGLILTVCGFVISIISSQIAISSVGLIIGKGALISVILITLVLPSALYYLDKPLLKLTIRKKDKKKKK